MAYPHGPVVRVHCTKELITTAVAADSTNCFVAEAVKAAYPQARNVAVDVATIRFSDFTKGYRYVYLTPYIAQQAIIEFDDGKAPTPFAFSLRGAHVTRAGYTATEKAAAKRKNEKYRDKRRELVAKKRAAKERELPKRATLVLNRGKDGPIPHRVGGRRAPQLRMTRHFGVRLFRGASQARAEATESK